MRPGLHIRSCRFPHHRKGRSDVNPLMVVLTLLVTIAAALALGVALGYAAVYSILRAMRRQSQTVAEQALATTEASGD